jgi:RimJ/RimL family protein N-acetyltransferase
MTAPELLLTGDRRVDALTTDRLRLRRWRAEDREPFAAMNADPRVMEFFPALMTADESDGLAERADRELAERGWGLWALEPRSGPDAGRFAGFTGLSIPPFELSSGACVEVGWRLPVWAWGRGYASEAARASLAVGFDVLRLAEIVSFTTKPNLRSRAVMERLGMTRDPADDFDHPKVPPDWPLKQHVLYRAARPQRAEPDLAAVRAGEP